MPTFKQHEDDKLVFDQIHPTQLEFSSEQLRKIREKLAFEKLNFFFVPSVELRHLTAQGVHPHVKQFPVNIKTGILLGNSISLKKEIVMQYLEKTLEEPWKFMLSYGEIRVKQDKSFNFQGIVKK